MTGPSGTHGAGALAQRTGRTSQTDDTRDLKHNYRIMLMGLLLLLLEIEEAKVKGMFHRLHERMHLHHMRKEIRDRREKE